MNKLAYWICCVIALALVLVTWTQMRLPQNPDVDLQLVQQFYESQVIWACLIGVLVGVIGAWLARRFTRHEANDRGADYGGRVAWRGFLCGLVASLVALVVLAGTAAVTEFDPLGPVEAVWLVLGSWVALGITFAAFVAALVLFAIITRMPTSWSGQYALLPRF